MNYAQWKQKVWPILPPKTQAEIRAYVRELQTEGWGMTEAWIQAACTY